MEGQPQNPEFRNNLEKYHPCLSWAKFITVRNLFYMLSYHETGGLIFL